VRRAGAAALRAGAGLISLATRPAHAATASLTRPELLPHAVDDASDLAPLLERASVVAIGPGLGRGDWGRALLDAVLAQPHALVLDADALNLLAAAPRPIPPGTILTPHPGEAARLLGSDAAAIQGDRFGAVRALASRYQAVVVLKGAGSLVAEPSGRLAVCPAGNPGMASGGMGDLLTGVIAALHAQHLGPWEAACLGVLMHAQAGDRAAGSAPRGLLASDLLPALRTLANTAPA
jgi:NAD(P)H-hydrate epimerase